MAQAKVKARAGNPLVNADDLAAALGKPVPCNEPAVIEVANAADTWLVQYLTDVDADGNPIDHSTHDYCKRAALRVAVETWSASVSAGGQPVSNDFQPSPYALGNTLLRMVAGLIAPCRDVKGLIG
jgi:hypothetical protein